MAPFQRRLTFLNFVFSVKEKLSSERPTYWSPTKSRVTASAGMDALTHAIEACVSERAQSLTRPLALEAVRLIDRSLRRAVADGRDLEARRHMAKAGLIAGLAFANGLLGGVHTIAMEMGGGFGVPHGAANALMLHHVMEFNELAVLEEYARIPETLGERVERLPLREAAHLASVAVHRHPDP